MTLEGYLDTKQAALELGVTEGRIRQLLTEGLIQGAIKVPEDTKRGVWLIPRSEIERLSQERGQQRHEKRKGRPPKVKDA